MRRKLTALFMAAVVLSSNTSLASSLETNLETSFANEAAVEMTEDNSDYTVGEASSRETKKQETEVETKAAKEKSTETEVVESEVADTETESTTEETEAVAVAEDDDGSYSVTLADVSSNGRQTRAATTYTVVSAGDSDILYPDFSLGSNFNAATRPRYLKFNGDNTAPDGTEKLACYCMDSIKGDPAGDIGLADLDSAKGQLAYVLGNGLRAYGGTMWNTDFQYTGEYTGAGKTWKQWEKDYFVTAITVHLICLRNGIENHGISADDVLANMKSKGSVFYNKVKKFYDAAVADDGNYVAGGNFRATNFLVDGATSVDLGNKTKDTFTGDEKNGWNTKTFKVTADQAYSIVSGSRKATVTKEDGTTLAGASVVFASDKDTSNFHIHLTDAAYKDMKRGKYKVKATVTIKSKRKKASKFVPTNSNNQPVTALLLSDVVVDKSISVLAGEPGDNFNVTVTKKDEKTKKSLTGAVFTLYYQTNGGAWNKVADLGWRADKSCYYLQDVETPADAKGPFKVVETQAPANYVARTPQWEEIFKADGTDHDFIFDCENPRVTGNVTGTKVDRQRDTSVAQGDATLAGGTYGIYAAANILSPDDSSVVYKAGDLVTTTLTEEDGSFKFTGLYLGSYKVREITPPKGYLLDEKEYDANLVYANQTTPVVSAVVKSDEQVITRPIALVKVEATDDSKEAVGLANVGFKFFLISDLSKVKSGELTPANGTSWTAEDFADYDFSQEETALYFNGDKEERLPELFTEDDGSLVTPRLPYGDYVGWESTLPNGDYKQLPPFVCSVYDDSAKPLEYRTFANKPNKTYLKIIKYDTTTGKNVLNNEAWYRIYNKDTQEYVTQKTKYPKAETFGTEDNPFRTNSDGYLVLPEPLRSGTYVVEEVKAPANYVKQGVEGTLGDGYEFYPDSTVIGQEENSVERETEISSEVETEVTAALAETEASSETETEKKAALPPYRDDKEGTHWTPNPSTQIEITLHSTIQVDTEEIDGEQVKVAVVRQGNDPQYGKLSIYKEGEFLANMKQPSEDLINAALIWLGLKDKEIKNAEVTYEKLPMHEVKFEVRAREDIYTSDGQGDLLYAKDSVVAELTTGEDGKAFTDKLPLGKYYLHETATNEGFILAKDVNFEITSPGQEIPFSYLGTRLENARQKIKIRVVKKDSKTGKPVPNANFTLYNKEDILNYKGEVTLPKDSPVAVGTTDDKGKLEFEVDLPLGIYYVKENKSSNGYFENDESYEVDCTYKGADVDAITKTLEVTNVPMEPKVKISKLADKTTGAILVDGRYDGSEKISGLYEANEEVRYKIIVTNSGNCDLINLRVTDTPSEPLLKYVVEDSLEFQTVDTMTTDLLNEIKVTKNGKLDLTLDKLEVGDSFTVEVTGKIVPETMNATELDNVVKVTSEYGEPDDPLPVPEDEDDHDNDKINVHGIAKVAIAKLANKTKGAGKLKDGRYPNEKKQGTYAQGEKVEYKISVTNTGTVELVNLIVNDKMSKKLTKTVDDDISFVVKKGKAKVWTKNRNKVTVTLKSATQVNIDHLAVGDTVVLKFRGTVKKDAKAGKDINNVVEVTAEYDDGKSVVIKDEDDVDNDKISVVATPEEKKPTGTTPGRPAPRTGDNTPVTLMVIIFCLAGVVIVATNLKKIKKQYDEHSENK